MQEYFMLTFLHLESICNGNNRSLQSQLCRFINSIKKNGAFHTGEMVRVSAASVLYLQSERASHLYTHGCVWVSERKTTKNKICHYEKVKRSLSRCCRCFDWIPEAHKIALSLVLCAHCSFR